MFNEIILLVFAFFIIFSYSLLILLFGYFFNKKSKSVDILHTKEKKSASVIIPARNEAEFICLLLSDLAKQTYPKDLYEIIIVDDESNDNTADRVLEYIERENSLNCRLLKINEKTPSKIYGYFKKGAISFGIKHAKGEIILTTDADCRMGDKWIETHVQAFNNPNIKMATGMVGFIDDKSHFEKAQHLEFLSLIASSIASIKMGYPIMCNGANLSYKKSAFEEVNGYLSDIDYASGDDIFLLLKIKKKFGFKSVVCLQTIDNIVYTKAKTTFKEFIYQRLRWASKTKGYKDFFILFVAAIVFFMNLGLMIFFLLSFYSISYLKVFLFLMILKNTVDIPILFSITTYVKRRDLRKYIIPLNFVYFIYFNIAGILGSVLNYKWKGRVVKK